jgi:glycosyltransferase involved in cell wall biosynthesis
MEGRAKPRRYGVAPRGMRDGGLGAVIAYGIGLLVSVGLLYGFNAMMARRLSPSDYSAFVALTAGLVLGIAAGFVVTHLLLGRDRVSTSNTLRPEVWLVMGGLLFLSVSDFAGVLAVRVAGGDSAGPYTAASSLARFALYIQGAAVAYALTEAVARGADKALNKTLMLALCPALLAVVVLEAFPGQILGLAYGGRFTEATLLVRLLTPSLAMAGLSLVLASLMMGEGRSSWVWSIAAVSSVGLISQFLVASAPVSLAVVTLVVQVALLTLLLVRVTTLVKSRTRPVRAVVFLMWRDTRHPQGGGAELYVEELARRLTGSGYGVTIFCSRYEGAARDEVVEGVRFVRRGSWRTVYIWGAIYHLLGRFGPHEVVVDVQNGIPFFAPIYTERRVIALVFHVHREQWPLWFPAGTAKVGWWIESWLSPRLYSTSQYVVVSEATKRGMVELGVESERISVITCGSSDVSPAKAYPKFAEPTLIYVGRLVPNKRLELLLDAAARLRVKFPDLKVLIVGKGPWEPELRKHVAKLGLEGIVRFEGFVEEATKQRLMRQAWVLVQPSIAEGWGLTVVEAGTVGTPSVAFRVGGLTESIQDGVTGLLAKDFDGFVDALATLLRSEPSRSRMGRAASTHAARFSWQAAAESMAALIADVDRKVDLTKETEPAPVDGALDSPSTIILSEPSVREESSSAPTSVT